MTRTMAWLLAVAAMGLAAPVSAEAPSPEATAAQVKAGVDAWSLGDYPKAVKAWQGPADTGDADAQFNLAQAYKSGRGVPQDMTRAEALYARAARQGHLQAADNYGVLLFQSGRREQALPWVTASAERGEPRAQYVLGIASFNGDTVGRDWVRAYALMTRAAATGMPQAIEALQAMDKSIPLEQRQLGISLAGELERQTAETRSRQLASADLGVAGPIRQTPPPSVIAATDIPPSSAAAPATGDMPGADFANGAQPASPPKGQPKAQPRVVGSYITGAPSPADAPAPAPGPAAKPAPAKVAPPPPAASGNWRIQLGAFGQKANADALWSRVRGNARLAGRSRFDVPAGAVTRLQAGPFATEADARAACSALSATSGACTVVRK